jgi:hypothetical protein
MLLRAITRSDHVYYYAAWFVFPRPRWTCCLCLFPPDPAGRAVFVVPRPRWTCCLCFPQTPLDMLSLFSPDPVRHVVFVCFLQTPRHVVSVCFPQTPLDMLSLLVFPRPRWTCCLDLFSPDPAGRVVHVYRRLGDGRPSSDAGHGCSLTGPPDQRRAGSMQAPRSNERSLFICCEHSKRYL